MLSTKELGDAVELAFRFYGFSLDRIEPGFLAGLIDLGYMGLFKSEVSANEEVTDVSIKMETVSLPRWNLPDEKRKQILNEINSLPNLYEEGIRWMRFLPIEGSHQIALVAIIGVKPDLSEKGLLEKCKTRVGQFLQNANHLSRFRAE